MNLFDVLRLAGQGASEAEIVEAYRSAKAEQEQARRARLVALGAPADSVAPATWLYHQASALGATSYTALSDDEIAALTAQLDYKRYLDRPQRPLPRPPPWAADLETCLRGRRSTRRFAGRPITEVQLARILALGAGVSLDGPVPRRTHPSGGALYPIELYPLVLDVADVAPGLYHYAALEHALEALPTLDGVDLGLLGSLRDARPAVALFMTVRLARTQAKYGERGYRFALAEVGHIAQSCALVAEAQGLGSVCFGGFLDDALNALLGLDTSTEVALYGVLVGARD